MPLCYLAKAVARSRFGPEGCEAEGRQLGVQTLGRLAARSNNRDRSTIWQTRQAQYDAVGAWGIPDVGRLQRVGALDRPVFVADGDSG